MFPLNIQNDVICFRDIKTEHLPRILEWYNKVDEFKYATGIDMPITIEVLTERYTEAAICSSEFFTGIYTKNPEKLIGILKGSLRYKYRDAAWISSIVIDTMYQNLGYGSLSLNLLLGYLKKNCNVRSVYLAVIEDNLQGRRFWEKNNFRELRRIENYIKLMNKHQNVIIMYRKL